MLSVGFEVCFLLKISLYFPEEIPEMVPTEAFCNSPYFYDLKLFILTETAQDQTMVSQENSLKTPALNELEPWR